MIEAKNCNTTIKISVRYPHGGVNKTHRDRLEKALTSCGFQTFNTIGNSLYDDFDVAGVEQVNTSASKGEFDVEVYAML
jgi:hypothetical protein